MTAVAGFNPVFITGAAGFVGACAVRELLQRGHEVHVLLRPQSNLWRLRTVLNQLHIHRGDINDAAVVQEVLKRVRPRVVLHLATYGAYENQADAHAILHTNILGTLNLLEASAEAGVGVFVSSGSSSEYGFKADSMGESDLLEPNSFYAIGKAAQTHLCQYIAKRCELSMAVLRLFSVYGPWEEPTRLMPTLIRRARAGLPLQMVSPRTVRDFVYVEDVLEAMLNFPALLPLRGEVINLGTGLETALQDVVTTVLDLLGSRSEVHWGAMAARHWDSNRWAADRTKAKTLLNWEPRHSLRQGLSRMAAWMEAGDYHGIEDIRAAG